MTKIARRELVQLAEVYDPLKHLIAGWYISEKLDGTRMLWDGGVSRGLRTVDVPWAGIYHPKTMLLKEKIKPIATGLWSRYGNPIMAPDWFLDALPPCPLDGEGWAGRGKFQLCRSILGGDEPDHRWDQIKFMVYGCPSPVTLTRPGLIKSTQMFREIGEDALQWFLHNMQERCAPAYRFLQDDTAFINELTALEEALDGCNVAEVHTQHLLPNDEAAAIARATELVERWVAEGAEGGIVRSGTATYDVKRVKTLLKIKPSEDDEGTLVGFTAGKGKHEGKIGALVLDYKGKRLEIGTGLTDADRVFSSTTGQLVGGKDVAAGCRAERFAIGQSITFTYRELSDAGIPKEARFLRVRGDE